MDYIEAKERCRKLKESLSTSLGVDEAFGNNGAVMSEFAQTCENALDKQIGQKPLVVEEYNGEWVPIRYSCQECGGDLINMFVHYCPNCGQKIDFKEG